MNYTKVLEYYEDLTFKKTGAGPMRGTIPGLERIKMLCDRLGNPENKCKYVHICGTNGKGSVAAFLSSVMREASISCGTFTSPAVFDFIETVKINNKPVSKNKYAEAASLVISEVEKMEEEGLDIPTSFEIQVVVALTIFAKAEVDIAIVECGMGGIWDATNIITNTIVACICKIGMDHTSYLGKTIEAIAQNKCGIIKNGCSVVSAPQKDSVWEIIKSQAEAKNAKIYKGKDIKNIKALKTLTRFEYNNLKDLEINLLGIHQVNNASLVIDICECLKDNGINIPEKSIRNGLKNTIHPGRFEIISKNPIFIVDGAHNEDASLAFSEALEYYFTQAEKIFIVGMFADKDTEKVLKIVSGAKAVITFKPDSYRGKDALELANEARIYTSNVTSAGSAEEAVEIAKLLADKNDVIAAFGSLSTIAKIKKCVALRG